VDPNPPLDNWISNNNADMDLFLFSELCQTQPVP
jgi:hypothetical protein